MPRCACPLHNLLARRRIFASTLEDLAAAREGLLAGPASIGSSGSVSGAASAPDHDGFVLKLRGLPYATTAEQVVDFLGPTVPVAHGAEVRTRTS